ncbi:tetratricopeptide repeat protein [Spirochaetota bacterium]
MQNKVLTTLILSAVLLTVNNATARVNSTGMYKTGEKLALNGKIDGAIKIFQRVIEINPYYCLGHYGLGKAYLYKKGFLDEAIKHLKKAVTLDKRLSKGYFYLGMAYYLSEKYVRALHAFKNSYKYDDSLIAALYNIAVIYDVTKQKYEAGIYYSLYKKEKVKDEKDLPF